MERNFSLAFAYAIEEAFKKDNKGFKYLNQFAAHIIAGLIEKALLSNGAVFEAFAHKEEHKDAFFGCRNSIEYELELIEKAILTESGIDDGYSDYRSDFISEYQNEVIAAHPEILDDEDENFFFDFEE